MKNLLRFSVAALCGFLALALSTGTYADEIRIGVIQAQSGMYAGFGTGGTFGIKAAAEDINSLCAVQVGD